MHFTLQAADLQEVQATQNDLSGPIEQNILSVCILYCGYCCSTRVDQISEVLLHVIIIAAQC